MSIFEKVSLTWTALLFPIFIYGLLEIEKGGRMRWVLGGIWLIGLFFMIVYKIWN